MNKCSFPFGLIGVLVACGGAPAAASEGEGRPNILFILTDDQRSDCMSVAGHPYLETPNMDRLAREGVWFRNAFVTTSLCSPSRGSFLTGLYARVHGVTNNNYDLNFARTPTFPEYLQKAGYDTAYVGKYHMGWDDRRRPGYNTWISYEGQGVYFDQVFTYNGVKIRTAGYNSDVTTDFAIGWLQQERKTPFMLYLSYKAPHQPWTPPPRNEGRYEGKEWPFPPSFWASAEGKPEYVRENFPAGVKTKREHAENGAGEPSSQTRQRREDRMRKFIQRYSECVKGIDDNLGRLWKAFEEMGVMDNTLIIFAGDNGYFFGEHRRADKRGMYEPSIRIPLLMRYPKVIPSGRVVEELVLNIDVAPTILEVAGVKATGVEKPAAQAATSETLPPIRMEGRSVMRLVQGRESQWRDAFLYEYLHEEPYRYPTMYGVRTNRWAYIHYPKAEGQDELYDMTSDPHQLRNLAKDPAHERDAAAMKTLLIRLERETGERAPPNTVPDTGKERMGRSITVPDR